MHAVLFNFYGYKLRITHETFHAYLQSWSALIRDLVHAVDNRKSNGCHQNCLWNVKFLISNAHNYLCRIQECWKKNSAMTIILKIISWRKYLPRNRKLTCSSKNSVISGVIVTWTKLHPVKQSNVWKKKLEYLDQCQTTPFPLIVKLAKSDDPLLNQLCSVLERYVVTSQAALRQFCTVSQRGVNAPLFDKKNSGTPAEFHFLTWIKWQSNTDLTVISSTSE